MARLVENIDGNRVRSNLDECRQLIADAARRAGRQPESVELLAATKYVPSELMGVLAGAGIELVGENQAQALSEKHQRWGSTFSFDFIGHLQSRKAKQVLPLVRLIHSIDSESAVRRLDQAAAERPAEVLVEVNVAGEATKGGIASDQVDRFLDLIDEHQRVCVRGLMTMPPQVDDPGQARPYFAALRELADGLARSWAGRHSFEVLSMGTSQDFAVAVEEGATIVRLGQRLYE